MSRKNIRNGQQNEEEEVMTWTTCRRRRLTRTICRRGRRRIKNEDLPDEDTVARNLKAVTFVVVLYEGKWFLAEVCYNQSGVRSSYTCLNYKTDLVTTFDKKIILEKVEPEPVISHDHLGPSKIDLKSMESGIVTVYLAVYKIIKIFGITFLHRALLEHFHIFVIHGK